MNLKVTDYVNVWNSSLFSFQTLPENTIIKNVQRHGTGYKGYLSNGTRVTFSARELIKTRIIRRKK